MALAESWQVPPQANLFSKALFDPSIQEAEAAAGRV